jgi:hypothetical protein
MTDDHDLARRLHDVAGRVSATPDLAEVEQGSRRMRSRRRATIGVVAAMLVAGAGGLGFGIGRQVADDDAGLASPAPEPAATTPADAEAPAATVPTAAPTTVADPQAPPTTTLVPTTEPAVDDGADDATGDAGWSAIDDWADQYQLVAERELRGGEQVRVHLGPDYGGVTYEDSGWQPAPFCWGTRELRIALAGPGVVDVVQTSAVGGELYGGFALQMQTAGMIDRVPYRVLVVQADDATTAAVTYADGATDRADLVDGLAVLVAPGPFDGQPQFRLDLTGGSAPRTLTSDDLDRSDDPGWREACEPPPPALPEPGDPPADPAAADAEIRANMALLYDRSIPREEKPDHLVDDWTGIPEAQQQVSEGPYADAAAGAVFTIEELVFTSPDEAWFRYRIDSPNGTFGDRFGVARFVDGHWRIVRATVCQDLSLAGGQCEEGVSFHVFPGQPFETSMDGIIPTTVVPAD